MQEQVGLVLKQEQLEFLYDVGCGCASRFTWFLISDFTVKDRAPSPAASRISQILELCSQPDHNYELAIPHRWLACLPALLTWPAGLHKKPTLAMSEVEVEFILSFVVEHRI